MEVQPEEYSLGMGKVAGSSPVHGSKWATPARRNPVRGIAHSESPSSESSGVTAEERFRLRFARMAQRRLHLFCKQASNTGGSNPSPCSKDVAGMAEWHRRTSVEGETGVQSSFPAPKDRREHTADEGTGKASSTLAQPPGW